MNIWLVSGGLHVAAGFVIGWIVFKRPQWATNLIEKAKAKIRFW